MAAGSVLACPPSSPECPKCPKCPAGFSWAPGLAPPEFQGLAERPLLCKANVEARQVWIMGKQCGLVLDVRDLQVKLGTGGGSCPF